jgi:hypothetical protein
MIIAIGTTTNCLFMPPIARENRLWLFTLGHVIPDVPFTRPWNGHSSICSAEMPT